MKENYLKSNIMEVYKHPMDKEAGIPPLFRFQYEIFDVDLDKVELGEMKMIYKLK